MGSLTRDPRVLIVDDDLALLDALSETLVLRMAPISVDTCERASSALKKLAAKDYDAIISDIKMPGMDGLTLLGHVRETFPDIPTLLITGHGQLDLAVQALRSGAFDLIQKPLDRDHLTAALKRAIETRRLRRELKESQEALRMHAAELERRVDERTADLKRALQAKDEFLALVSHELRTPVSVIFGNIELLNKLGDKLAEDDKEAAMNDLRREGRRLRRLVENILALARVEYGVANEPVPVSLMKIISQQVEWHHQMYPERPIDLQLVHEIPPVICDDFSVELVLGNLLANAEKYSRPAQPIQILIQADREAVAVSVRDRGLGVAPEDAERIFDPFYRSESSSGVKGMGIGLAVCKRLLEAYGGRVWLMPHEGGGSDFSFSLPVASEPQVPEVAKTGVTDMVQA
jgi:two-component system, sensor histidine kinase and response regulator